MEKLRSRRPSAGTILGALALMVALGGTAIGLPGRAKIDRNDLRNNVVQSRHIVDGQVGSADVGNGQIGSVDVGDGQIGSAEVGSAQIGSAELKSGEIGSAQLVGCAAGTVLIDGFCWDQNVRTSQDSLIASMDTCSAAGGRLPTPGQLRGVRNETGFDLGANGAALNHYADAVHEDDGSLQTIAVEDDGDFRVVGLTADQFYRCVYERVR